MASSGDDDWEDDDDEGTGAEVLDEIDEGIDNPMMRMTAVDTFYSNPMAMVNVEDTFVHCLLV